jgi:hypothetical protein
MVEVAALDRLGGPWLMTTMGLDLTPRDYLEMLTDEYREYLEQHWPAIHVQLLNGTYEPDQWHAHRVSMRKAINCCSLSNALPEIIFAHYGRTEPEKVHRTKSASAYREHLRKQCEAHHTVRDICDYSKHGPILDKRKHPPVSVQEAKRIKRKEGRFRGLLALTETHEVERLVVRHRDGRTELLDDILEEVTASWKAIFDQDKL